MSILPLNPPHNPCLLVLDHQDKLEDIRVLQNEIILDLGKLNKQVENANEKLDSISSDLTQLKMALIGGGK
jgi:archaellum component FlaC